jgi:hypothetical protein
MSNLVTLTPIVKVSPLFPTKEEYSGNLFSILDPMRE